jgi:hypothetical protein
MCTLCCAKFGVDISTFPGLNRYEDLLVKIPRVEVELIYDRVREMMERWVL